MLHSPPSGGGWSYQTISVELYELQSTRTAVGRAGLTDLEQRERLVKDINGLRIVEQAAQIGVRSGGDVDSEVKLHRARDRHIGPSVLALGRRHRLGRCAGTVSVAQISGSRVRVLPGNKGRGVVVTGARAVMAAGTIVAVVADCAGRVADRRVGAMVACESPAVLGALRVARALGS